MPSFANPRILAGLLLLGIGLVEAQAQPGDPQGGGQGPGLSNAELERRQARIGEVHIIIGNVFDTSDPAEDKALYRWANRFHVMTQEHVVHSALLFEEGDPYRGRVLAESERALRATGFVAEAMIAAGEYHTDTNTVDINVFVRDAWTLQPDLSFNRSGGVNEYQLGATEDNLFGLGKSISLGFEKTIDREGIGFAYSDPNIRGGRTRLDLQLADTSDGGRVAIAAGRPFFSLDTHWSTTGNLIKDKRIDQMYDLGEVVDEFEHSARGLSIQGGRSRGGIGNRALRWLAGMSYQEDLFQPDEHKPMPELLPENRKLVYPWLGVHWIHNDYREVSELNDMGRIEDVGLGLNVFASLGYSTESLGADRNATIWNLSVSKGFEPGGPGRLFLVDAAASWRGEDEGLQNGLMVVDARYYRRDLGRHLFSVSLLGAVSSNLDADKQVLLGGDTGLRGFPIRYQAGQRSAVLTVEQRFFTDWYPFSLVRVGYAAFFDVGRVWGQDPRATPPLGILYDVGFGMRLTSPRSSGSSVIHVDLAFPVNGDESIDSVQLVIGKKKSF